MNNIQFKNLIYNFYDNILIDVINKNIESVVDGKYKLEFTKKKFNDKRIQISEIPSYYDLLNIITKKTQTPQEVFIKILLDIDNYFNNVRKIKYDSKLFTIRDFDYTKYNTDLRWWASGYSEKKKATEIKLNIEVFEKLIEFNTNSEYLKELIKKSDVKVFEDGLENTEKVDIVSNDTIITIDSNDFVTTYNSFVKYIFLTSNILGGLFPQDSYKFVLDTLNIFEGKLREKDNKIKKYFTKNYRGFYLADSKSINNDFTYFSDGDRKNKINDDVDIKKFIERFISIDKSLKRIMSNLLDKESVDMPTIKTEQIKTLFFVNKGGEDYYLAEQSKDTTPIFFKLEYNNENISNNVLTRYSTTLTKISEFKEKLSKDFNENKKIVNKYENYYSNYVVERNHILLYAFEDYYITFPRTKGLVKRYNDKGVKELFNKRSIT